MQVFADGPRRARRYKLRPARRTAQATSRRTFCACCEQRRRCAQVDVAGGEWFCLAECWLYELGLAHGQQAAAYLVRQLVSRELDRVFDPLALELTGWPWWRCDGCGAIAPDFTTAQQLRDQLGWLSVGRDGHLCPACRPQKMRKLRGERVLPLDLSAAA
jgi:hypothetical protein